MRTFKSAYKEHEVIGQAHVVLVENLESHLYCISKKILITSLSPSEQDQSLQELSLLRNLKHPNIVTYYESFLEDDYLIIIMEYCEEGDLYYHIQRQKKKEGYFPEKLVLNWFLQAVMAVEFIHRNQVLHRDLKTSNIFLTACGSIKLGDFGIAKVLTNTHQITNTLVGTPNYLSPELCENKPYTYKADMWALGCVLYELLALKVPFQSNNLMELIVRIGKEDIEPLPKQYSKEIKTLVRSLLNKDENKRPNCQEILAKPMFIRVMQEFITGGAKLLQQKKVPIKQYSLHQQLKKKSPEKIIHKRKIEGKMKPEKPAKSALNNKASDMFNHLKIAKSPISPIKGVSMSNNSSNNTKITPNKAIKNQKSTPQTQKKTNSSNNSKVKPQSSLSKRPFEQKKTNNLKIAGVSISKPAQKPTLTEERREILGQEEKEEEDQTINSILMNTELSFNISLTQDSAFYTKGHGQMKIKEVSGIVETKESFESLHKNDNMRIEENTNTIEKTTLQENSNNDGAMYQNTEETSALDQCSNENVLQENTEEKATSANTEEKATHQNHIKIDENGIVKKNENLFFEDIETREDDDSDLEEEYKQDFEEDSEESNMDKLGRLTLPKTKEKLNEILDLYKSQLAESQKLAQMSLYEGNLRVIEEDLCEMSSQDTTKKKGENTETTGFL